MKLTEQQQEQEQEQAFLDEVYRKARLLEYDKREAQKVLYNRRMLARRQAAVICGITIITAAVALLIRMGKLDQPLCIAVSLLLIVTGLLVERLELTWNPENDR